MNYIITGSLGHVGRPLAAQLIKAGHSVTVVSSNPERKARIESMGAEPAIGTVEDVGFLTGIFKGADALFTMVPPNYTGSDWKEYIARIGRNYAEAITSSGVRHVVNLSSIGAHMHEKCGPVSGLHLVEHTLNAIHGVHVRHLRAGFFYTNFLNSIGMIRSQGVMGGNYGEKTLMVLVHPSDIADEAAKELQDTTALGRGFRYIASDEKTTDEIATILGKAIGKPELRWVDRSDKETYEGMVQAGMPDETARNYTEMGAAMRSGEMEEHYFSNRPVMAGWRRFEAFATEFAAAYGAS
jgi:uncharacterized protein YbjT (DUF2867 family)